MDVSKKLDYICTTPYRELTKVLRASNFSKPNNFSWRTFWSDLLKELSLVKTKIVVLNRIGPYSPNTHHIAFASERTFSPSNLLTVVRETNEETAKAFCVMINSVIFLSQFFILKEDTTGRYIHLSVHLP